MGATVVITGDDNLATAGSATLDLDEGANTLTVTVTAADTMTMKTYTVALVRAASAPPADPNAIWTANLTVGSGGGTLGDPSFGELWLSPRQQLRRTRAPRFHLQLVDRHGKGVRVLPNPTFPWVSGADHHGLHRHSRQRGLCPAFGGDVLPLLPRCDKHRPRIDVGSLDWNVGDVVLVKLGRPPNDATLSALGLEDGDGATVSLSPGFNRTTDSYTALVSDDVDEVTLTATQNNPGATVAITADDDSSTPNDPDLRLRRESHHPHGDGHVIGRQPHQDLHGRSGPGVEGGEAEGFLDG